MASQVLSGSSNPSYTNNTGQNVRIVINFMSNVTSISWGGVSVSTSSTPTIGRNLAFINGTGNGDSNNMILPYTTTTSQQVLVSTDNFTGQQNFTSQSVTSSNLAAYPTELMLAPGQAFNSTCGAYNIVVIPEAG